MPYSVRLMCREDIAPVTDIDREAFPTMWPPVNFEHELQNRLAHYIVACDDERTVETVEIPAATAKGFSGLISRGRHLFQRLSNGLPPPGRQYVVGFIGFWIMVDEAHIINIAVRESYRRQGIGELLLIAMIDMAMELKANILTLEVRASNKEAQSLYSKYGFVEVGLRRGYYIDNKEDAILMSTEEISSASFQSRFQELKQACCEKLGIVLQSVSKT